MLVTTKSKNIGYCDVCRKNSFTRRAGLYVNRKSAFGRVYTDEFGYICVPKLQKKWG